MRSLKSDFVAAVILLGVPLVLGIVRALIFSVGFLKPSFEILLRHPALANILQGNPSEEAKQTLTHSEDQNWLEEQGRLTSPAS